MYVVFARSESRSSISILRPEARISGCSSCGGEIFGSVVEAYVFVEHERDALLDVVYRVFGRCGAYYFRRGFVVGAAVGTSGVCT